MRQITGPIQSLLSPLAAGIGAVQQRLGRSGRRGQPRPVRLYRRDEQGLAYVWVDAAGDTVEFRAGNLGHPAETALYDPAHWARISDHIDNLRETGFAEVPPHDMQSLEIVFTVAGDTADDAERARLDALTEKAEAFLAQTGQGQWVDASTGDGAMQTVFLVIDGEVARATLARHLADSPFADYSTIRISASGDEAADGIDEPQFANAPAEAPEDEYPFIPAAPAADDPGTDPEQGFANAAPRPPRRGAARELPDRFDRFEPAS